MYKTLEKTEWAIRNGKSRDTGKIGHTTHSTKTVKTKPKTQHRKLQIWATHAPPENRDEPMCSRRV